MLQRSRVADPNFRPSDYLYYRVGKEDVVGDRLLAPRIAYKNVSVNWSKYSKPWDVIFDFPGAGFVRFVVRNLPKELPKDPPPLPKKAPPLKLHSFKPGHVPEPENYSHSEIWTFKDGKRDERANLSETVKKEFRMILAQKALMLHAPES